MPPVSGTLSSAQRRPFGARFMTLFYTEWPQIRHAFLVLLPELFHLLDQRKINYHCALADGSPDCFQ